MHINRRRADRFEVARTLESHCLQREELGHFVEKMETTQERAESETRHRGCPSFNRGAHGATIEVACSRMRYISVQKQREEEDEEKDKKSPPPIRIVGLSASVANAKDLAEWLGVNSKRQFNFAPSARPTPLRLFVRGFDVVNYESRVQAMSRPTYRAIKTHAEQRTGDCFRAY